MAAPRDAGALRIARVAEAAYAASALVVASQLPEPGPPNAQEWVHWLGTALLAALIAMKLRRPNHVVWWVAAALAAYVLGAWLAAAARTGRMNLPTAPVAVALIAMLLGSQVVVAVCLARLRHLRRAHTRS